MTHIHQRASAGENDVDTGTIETGPRKPDKEKYLSADATAEPMALHTRRQLVAAGLGTVSMALLAGCADGERPNADEDEANGNRQPNEHEPGLEEPLTELSVETVRFDPDVDRLIAQDDAEDTNIENLRLPYIVETAQLELIDLQSDPIGDVDDSLSFLREIDYDEATGLLVEREVDVCHRYTLQYVEQRRSGDGVRTQFCRTTRDPSIECAVDDRHIQLTMVELPFATDEPYSGFGSGHSQSCRPPMEVNE